MEKTDLIELLRKGSDYMTHKSWCHPQDCSCDFEAVLKEILSVADKR